MPQVQQLSHPLQGYAVNETITVADVDGQEHQ